MGDTSILNGKRILAVDDEPDVLEVIQEELGQCTVTTAQTFESARDLIQAGGYDLIILDIMGVRGFDLLDECRKSRIPAAMLTAHSIDVQSLNRSIRHGAVSFLPKDELSRLPEILAEILESLEEGQSHWPKLFSRLGPFFHERLGVVWEDLERPPYPPYFY
ncbi:MAG: response regulator [Thermodesulfobacteriota bacterium]